MQSENTRQKLRLRAARLLCDDVYPVLMRYGRPFLTGSYVYDLMVVPELDLYLEMSPLNLDQCAQLCADLVKCKSVKRIKYSNRLDYPRQSGNTISGLWLRPTFADRYEDWDIDIWCIQRESSPVSWKDPYAWLINLSADEKENTRKLKLQLLGKKLYGNERAITSVQLYEFVERHRGQSLADVLRWRFERTLAWPALFFSSASFNSHSASTTRRTSSSDADCHLS